MILPLDLRQQFLDIVEIPAGFESQLMRLGMIRSLFRRLLNAVKPGTQSLIDYPPEGSAEPPCDGSRLL